MSHWTDRFSREQLVDRLIAVEQECYDLSRTARPAGRDLTAQDVRNAWLVVEPFDDQAYAEHLSRIARPSRGIGQPDTAAGSLHAPPPDDVTEALEWFRKNPERLLDRLVGVSDQRLAATIVRWLLSVVEGDR